jgi:bifunctional DNA-binding transcriptional regulator/antitoxin component of YhaV-PrlF toxin-antitoxin module
MIYHSYIERRASFMKVADEVWVSTALLHTENPERADFAVEEIKTRARQEKWTIRPGFNVHASYHCVANKSANPANHRMLYEDSRGRKRLYRAGDPCHSERQDGKVRPNKPDLPVQYQNLIDWYDSVYSRQSKPNGSGASSAASAIRGSEPEMLPLPGSSSAYVSSAGAFVIPEDLRRELGIREGMRLGIYREKDRLVLQPITKEFIRSLVGCAKGETSLVEAREREHRTEK